MKTKTFLLLCLLIGIGFTELSAQNGKDGTGSITEIYYQMPYSNPIYLDGVLIDHLEGIVDFNSVVHLKDGNMVFAKSVVLKGEARSTFPPYEVFRVQEIDKSAWEVNCVTWHFNFIGNLGSHYIGSVTWNFVTNETRFDKLVVAVRKKVNN